MPATKHAVSPPAGRSSPNTEGVSGGMAAHLDRAEDPQNKRLDDGQEGRADAKGKVDADVLPDLRVASGRAVVFGPIFQPLHRHLERRRRGQRRRERLGQNLEHTNVACLGRKQGDEIDDHSKCIVAFGVINVYWPIHQSKYCSYPTGVRGGEGGGPAPVPCHLTLPCSECSLVCLVLFPFASSSAILTLGPRKLAALARLSVAMLPARFFGMAAGPGRMVSRVASLSCASSISSFSCESPPMTVEVSLSEPLGLVGVLVEGPESLRPAVLTSSETKPLMATSCWSVPLSTISPSFSRKIESASESTGMELVARIRVLELRRPRGPRTLSIRCRPTCVSTAERQSSRRYTSALAYTARASASRALWPPLREMPRSPTNVSSPSGS